MNDYKKRKLLKVKPQPEVLDFEEYMFESLQSFNNSQGKAHSMFSVLNLKPEVSPSIAFFSYIYSVHAYLYQIYVSNKLVMVNCEIL